MQGPNCIGEVVVKFLEFFIFSRGKEEGCESGVDHITASAWFATAIYSVVARRSFAGSCGR